MHRGRAVVAQFADRERKRKIFRSSCLDLFFFFFFSFLSSVRPFWLISNVTRLVAFKVEMRKRDSPKRGKTEANSFPWRRWDLI